MCVNNGPHQKRTVSVYIFTLARQDAGKWAVRFPLILRGGGVTSPELRQQKKPIAKVVGRGPTDDTALYRREEGRESASQKQTPCRACVYVTPKLPGGFVPARMTLHFFPSASPLILFWARQPALEERISDKASLLCWCHQGQPEVYTT